MSLGLSVPVMSEALSALEDELGVTLATRSTRHFALTEAGRAVQARAAEILHLAETVTERAEDAQALSGTVAVSVPVELASFWLPRQVAAFRARHAAVTLRLDISDDVRDLRFGAIDLALRTRYSAPQAQRHPEAHLPLALIARTPPGISRDTDGVRLDIPLIDSRHDRQLMPVDREDGHAVPLHFSGAIEVNNRSASIAMVTQGLGAATVLRASVDEALSRGTLVQILPDLDFGALELGFVFRDRLPSREARAFVAIARELDASG